jgi:hypothetical protein
LRLLIQMTLRISEADLDSCKVENYTQERLFWLRLAVSLYSMTTIPYGYWLQRMPHNKMKALCETESNQVLK